jgi:hypothetical protein
MMVTVVALFLIKPGTLHGVIKSKLVGFATEGIGFAIPSSNVAEYLNLKID